MDLFNLILYIVMFLILYMEIVSEAHIRYTL